MRVLMCLTLFVAACSSAGGGDAPTPDAAAETQADAGAEAPEVTADTLAPLPEDCAVTPTLASLEADYFGKSCTFSSCHAAKAKKGGLDLSAGHAWESLVDVDSTQSPGKKRVVPGEPDASFLVQKLMGPAGGEGALMPEGSEEPFDPACRIEALRRWIAAGAVK